MDVEPRVERSSFHSGSTRRLSPFRLRRCRAAAARGAGAWDSSIAIEKCAPWRANVLHLAGRHQVRCPTCTRKPVLFDGAGPIGMKIASEVFCYCVPFHIVHKADGREESVSANWMVGCDGAHSAVSHDLGAPFFRETPDSG
jgi:hypothetical protein